MAAPPSTSAPPTQPAAASTSAPASTGPATVLATAGAAPAGSPLPPRATAAPAPKVSMATSTSGAASPAGSTSSPANGSTAAGSAAGTAAFRPLNVRDALSYLDRVKQQFSSEYEVYDHFLTIMKQFKTQAIDTPGVIDRVSSLFRGHPALIQGFNTFLPPGYRIECSISSDATTGTNGAASNTITVTTPMGVTTRTQGVAGEEARDFARSQPGAASSSGVGAGTAKPKPATPITLAAPSRPTTAASSATTARSAISPPAPIPPYSGAKPASTSQSAPGPANPAWQQKPPVTSTSAAAGHSRPPSTTSALPAKATTVGAALEEATKGSAIKKEGGEPMVIDSSVLPPLPTSSAPASTASTSTGNAPIPAPTSAAPVASTSAIATPAAASAAPAPAAGAAPQVMEFNHAINYVNKIKNRFVKDPETYKTFLEILQTYQKETRPIQEVYTQVTALFHSAPDLLDEFKAFLPDTTDPQVVAAQQAQQAAQQQAQQAQAKKPSSASGGQGKSVKGKEEKKKRAAPGMGERAKAKRAKTTHVDSPPVASNSKDRSNVALEAHHQPQPHQSSHVSAHHSAPHALAQQQAQAQQYHHPQPYGAPPPNFPGAARMQSAYDAYLQGHRSPQLVQAEEFGFFDRVKKYLDDRVTYTEFLKLLNLFTQEIIDIKTLLEKSLLFFGHNDDLVASFKELVGWDPLRDGGRIEGEDWVVDNESVFERPGVRLDLMKSFGPSYRKLPESEIDLACSGREPLDWSVLNDEWVAFATWASEGSSAHRKNPYEEALYNSEQERHWYSFHIASIERTIAYLEPIAARIALMSTEERSSFKMHEGFGGTAPSVYERIIRKVYGKDHGWEILSALFDNPSVAVPIVLSRLKQKDEEWKRAEREWNKVWREVDNKNFYRALDHQGIPFKAIDKKATTTSKALTSEIETLRRDKQQKRLDLPSNSSPLRPLHQFELGMPDREVLFDVLKLTFSFLDRDQSGFSAPERARVEAFLRLFVPLLFGVPHDEMEANLAHSDDSPNGDEEDNESETETAGGGSDAESAAEGTDGSTSASPAGKKNGIGGVNKKGGAADLRKRLLKHAAAAGGAPPKQSTSRANSPTEDDGATTPPGTILGEQTWIQLSESGEEEPAMDQPLPTRRFNFFANSTYYCLVRLIHTIYHRLATFKELTAQLAAERTHQRLNPLAVELGLAIAVPVVDDGENPAERYYEHALDLAEKLFDGDIDQQTYEEQLRYMGGIKAYPLFTLDKLVSTVIKHIHTVNSDSRCQDLVTLLEKDRARDFITTRQQIAYRMEAEAAIGSDDPLYRIEWIPESMALTIQLLGKEDLTLDDAYGSEEKMHASWVSSYALTSSTEGVGAQVKAPLLKRNRVLSEEEDPQEFDLVPGLEAKVERDGYQLHFVALSEDYLFRKRPAPEPESPGAVPVEQRRAERFREWLAQRSGTTSRGEQDVVMGE